MIGDEIMFVCLECGHVFSEPDCWEETHGLDYGPYESWSGCPSCHGGYIEAFKCDCCDEWIDGPYIKLESDERICQYCYTNYELGDER